MWHASYWQIENSNHPSDWLIRFFFLTFENFNLEQLTESLAEYDRQQDTLLKENKKLLKDNEDLETEIESVKREECVTQLVTRFLGQVVLHQSGLVWSWCGNTKKRDEVKEDLAQTLREIAEI